MSEHWSREEDELCAHLTNDVLLNIFSHLDTRSVLACAHTCRRWRILVLNRLPRLRRRCAWNPLVTPLAPLDRCWKEESVYGAMANMTAKEILNLELPAVLTCAEYTTLSLLLFDERYLLVEARRGGAQLARELIRIARSKGGGRNVHVHVDSLNVLKSPKRCFGDYVVSEAEGTKGSKLYRLDLSTMTSRKILTSGVRLDGRLQGKRYGQLFCRKGEDGSGIGGGLDVYAPLDGGTRVGGAYLVARKLHGWLLAALCLNDMPPRVSPCSRWSGSDHVVVGTNLDYHGGDLARAAALVAGPNGLECLVMRRWRSPLTDPGWLSHWRVLLGMDGADTDPAQVTRETCRSISLTWDDDTMPLHLVVCCQVSPGCCSLLVWHLDIRPHRCGMLSEWRMEAGFDFAAVSRTGDLWVFRRTRGKDEGEGNEERELYAVQFGIGKDDWLNRLEA